MSQKTDKIGEKLVFVSEPYEATVAPLVGREDVMRMVTAAWIAGKTSLPLSPLLLGEPGVGKNRLVYEMARRTGKRLFIFQGHEDVTAEDLACSVRFGDEKGKMDYVVSPLVTAMKHGDICFIDEIAKIRPRALALLVSVLDERRYIDSTLLGERVHAHNGFRFIAATNTADLEGSAALPEFLRSRMRPVILVGYPPREEINEIVHKRYQQRLQGRLENQVGPLLDSFWDLWGKKAGTTPPTPRDVIYVFDLAFSLADYALLGERRPLQVDGGGVAPLVEKEHLGQAFDELFKLNREPTS